MSFEAITNFFNDLDTKEELAKSFEEIDPDSNFKENLVTLGQKFGYDFTLEELEKVATSAKRIKEGASIEDQSLID